MKLFGALTVAFLFTLASLTPAQALTCHAVTQGNRILTFDSNSPGVVTTDELIVLSDPAYSVVGIAIRTTIEPGGTNAGVGSLWGICHNGTNNFRLCVLNPVTGAGTFVGGVLDMDDVGGADAINFGFDPAADRFQMISERFNYRIDPNTVTVTPQTNFPGFPAHSGAAFVSAPYTGGTSQFYNLSRQVDPRILQTSANIATGSVTAVGPLTVPAVFAPLGLSFGGSTLFLAVNGTLRTVNPASGASSAGVPIAGAPTIRGLAVVPASFPPKLNLSVKIAGKKTVITTASKHRVKGTVKSNAGIDLVEYRVGKGKFKKAKGTAKWKFKARLKPGLNKVQVRATVGTTTSKPAKMRIIRR